MLVKKITYFAAWTSKFQTLQESFEHRQPRRCLLKCETRAEIQNYLYEKQKIIVILNEEKWYAKKGNNPFAAVDKEIDLLWDREMLSTRPNGGLEVFGSVTCLNIGVRAICCQGGRGKPFPPKFLQVAQIFTKKSKRNEGHLML